MSTLPIVYKSTDSSAPVLTGGSGALLSLLQAVLVGTSGVAYGSGGTAKNAAGWSNPFTNTATKAVFKNSIGDGGTGMCLRLLDDASGGAGAKEAFMTGYATMSDIDTGTQITPTTAIAATGLAIRKSETADATARSWIIIADSITCYMWIWSQVSGTDTTKVNQHLIGFGDLSSDKASDPNRFFLAGRKSYNTSTSCAGLTVGSISYSSFNAIQDLYVGQEITGSGTSIVAQLNLVGGDAVPGSNSETFPDPLSSGNRLYYPVFVLTNPGASVNLRGRLRGAYQSRNQAAPNVTVGNTYGSAGAGGTAQLLALTGSSAGGARLGVLFFDTTNAWT